MNAIKLTLYFSPLEKHIYFYTAITTIFSFSFRHEEKMKGVIGGHEKWCLELRNNEMAYQLEINRTKHAFRNVEHKSSLIVQKPIIWKKVDTFIFDLGDLGSTESRKKKSRRKSMKGGVKYLRCKLLRRHDERVSGASLNSPCAGQRRHVRVIGGPPAPLLRPSCSGL